jgi:hypothetical protein
LQAQSRVQTPVPSTEKVQEVEASLFADNMILYVEKPKSSTKTESVTTDKLSCAVAHTHNLSYSGGSQFKTSMSKKLSRSHLNK